MLRTAGRAVYQQCRRGPSAPPLSVPVPVAVRRFSEGGGGEGVAGRLIELNTKADYVNFPKEKSVVYFTAKWCPPCRRIGPFLAELSGETEGVTFGKVDIDENEETASHAHIKSIPTFKFFQGGQEIDTMTGADANLLEQNVVKLAEA
eukprot:g16864.t1